ncbi:MAG: HEAT repeat domain-containing protein [Clostridia bacterium]|nr:HEAT repeat domain-containing protein [Clostridia bacterium]
MNDPDDRRDLLVKLFEHTLSQDPKLRAAAYRALVNFPPEDSIVSCLLSGLSDEDRVVRRAAGSVLMSYGYLSEKARAR